MIDIQQIVCILRVQFDEFGHMQRSVTPSSQLG